jgi:predicted metal-dependent hydrolase
MINFELIRQKRKTISIHIKDNKVVVKAPLYYPADKINAFVQSKENWINIKLSETKEQIVLSESEIKELKIKAKKYLPQRTSYFAEKTNLFPKSVKITSAKTRWGSCSGKDNISYTYRIMILPNHLIDYIILHELCHIKQKNHGKGFYDLLETFLPDYKNLQKELRKFRIQ